MRRIDELERLLRPAAGDPVADRIDHLLLPQFACGLVPLRAEHIAIAGVCQCAMSVEMLRSARKSVLEEIVVKTALHEDVDTAEVVNQFFEGGEIDPHEGVDRLI